MRERKRALAENDTASSFFGQIGHLNYVNSMFDLFLAGSETTSTSLNFTLLYLLHFPSIQAKLQRDLDEVVGRARKPSIEDKDKLPYLEAFIMEVQRHAAVVPIGVQHSCTKDTKFRNYVFPKNSMITFNLFEMMRDPANFEDPDKFKPERFLQDGKFKPHPMMVAFGMGKRECLGKPLAKHELFLFTANLLHQFTFEPGTEAIPGLDDVVVAVTRMPQKFKVRIVSRMD